MTTTTTPTPIPESIFQAFRTWINQRPGVDPQNYGDRKSYRNELASITRDRQRALIALSQAQAFPYSPDGMREALRAFSGRLSWNDEGGGLSYCTGQYWPTEYRKAAATVLESYIEIVRPKAAPDPNAQYNTIDAIERANTRAGYHFFKKDTKRFFRSRIYPEVYTGPGGIYFITSDQRGFESSSGRGYTVRKFNPIDGSIGHGSEFNAFTSRGRARSAAHTLAQGGKDAAA